MKLKLILIVSRGLAARKSILTNHSAIALTNALARMFSVVITKKSFEAQYIDICAQWE
jgi:hypothetical protein